MLFGQGSDAGREETKRRVGLGPPVNGYGGASPTSLRVLRALRGANHHRGFPLPAYELRGQASRKWQLPYHACHMTS